MSAIIRGVAVAASVFMLAAAAATAQDRRQNQSGQFDFYVLSLSWSPSFCEASAEKGRAPREQCGGRPYSFVVHGLWPQYERGFPEFCQNPAPRLQRAIVSSMLDLMPAPRLIFHQWDKHGVCSGLGPRAYFETVRKARAQVKIPEAFIELSRPLTVTPEEVERAFVESNPGLSRKGIAVTCDSRRLHEVRICMTRDLRFRECEETDRRACRRERMVMPPMRGGAARP
ncbi:MAG: ribonuclease T2 [Hyphomicrobiales bacterium]|nr:ribonuclease T2 [Hyphomicrobiales bacterium]